MATIYQTQGTDVTWKASGGTHVLTLTSLANNAGRKGDSHDFGANFQRLVRVSLLTKFAIAPTLGKTLDVWWSSSVDGSNFSGALAAGDAAQNDSNIVYQMRRIGSLPVLANTNAQSGSWVFPVYSRYGFPVLMNNATGQALTATAGDHVLTITPISELVQ